MYANFVAFAIPDDPLALTSESGCASSARACLAVRGVTESESNLVWATLLRMGWVVWLALASACAGPAGVATSGSPGADRHSSAVKQSFNH